MITFVFCLFLTIMQLLYVNFVVKPKSFYLCILHFFLIYPIIFNQLLPLTLQFINFSFQELLNTELIQAYILNFLYYFLVLAAWRKLTPSYKYASHITSFPEKIVLFAALCSIIYNSIKVLSYLNLLNLDLQTLLFPFNTFFYNFFKIVPFFLLFVYYHFDQKNTFLKLVILASIAIYFLSIIPTGHRSSLILPVIFLIFYISKSTFFKKAIISVICIFSFAQISDIYKSFRIILNPNEAINSQEFVSSTFIEEVNYRFSVSNEISAGIVEIINEDEPVGFEPLSSSILSVIPASNLDYKKPWPGSIDGTEFGILPRIAHQRLYQSGQNMSEYMYPLHPIWELGYAYYFFNILFVTLLLILFERASLFLGDRALLIPVATMLPFSYSYTFPPLVLLFQQLAYVFIPGIALYFLIKIFSFIFKPILSRKYIWKTI